MNKFHFNSILFALMFLTFNGSAEAQTATGGVFKLEQSVIANGGGVTKDGANVIAVESSTAQSIAVRQSSGGAYTVTGGFWANQTFAPTAATVSVSGRVLTAKGKGIRGALVSITDSMGIVRSTKSSARGSFYFSDVITGQTYIFTIKARRFQFIQNNQTFSITQDLTDLVFIAEDINTIN